MSWQQKTVVLAAKKRGIHLISEEIFAYLADFRPIRIGILHLFLQHTSASLSINENVCADVRDDLDAHLNQLVPEKQPYYTHTYEGSDDMPAHIKSSLIGCSLTLPISEGRPALGAWQGIYLCEHRNHGGSRRVVLTLHGE